MVSEREQEELWQRISYHFDSEAAGLKRATLSLQDAGWSPEAIRELIGMVWNAAYDSAWDEGYEHGASYA